MSIIMVTLHDALPRIATGEKPWEFETSDHNFRILGPGCCFGKDYLKRCRREGRYAQTVEEANSIALDRGITVIGAWLTKD